MSRKKPTLGYPSRTAAVFAMRDQGLSTAEIADRIGIGRTTVVALECSARRSANRGRTVVFPTAVLDRLQPHAARRGIGPAELVRRLVEEALDHDLIDAVLDDRP